MEDDFKAAAQAMLIEYGDSAELEIAKRHGDTLRGGDPDAISYWKGVRNAFAYLKK